MFTTNGRFEVITGFISKESCGKSDEKERHLKDIDLDAPDFLERQEEEFKVLSNALTNIDKGIDSRVHFYHKYKNDLRVLGMNKEEFDSYKNCHKTKNILNEQLVNAGAGIIFAMSYNSMTKQAVLFPMRVDAAKGFVFVTEEELLSEIRDILVKSGFSLNVEGGKDTLGMISPHEFFGMSIAISDYLRVQDSAEIIANGFVNSPIIQDMVKAVREQFYMEQKNMEADKYARTKAALDNIADKIERKAPRSAYKEDLQTLGLTRSDLRLMKSYRRVTTELSYELEGTNFSVVYLFDSNTKKQEITFIRHDEKDKVLVVTNKDHLREIKNALHYTGFDSKDFRNDPFEKVGLIHEYDDGSMHIEIKRPVLAEMRVSRSFAGRIQAERVKTDTYRQLADSLTKATKTKFPDCRWELDYSYDSHKPNIVLMDKNGRRVRDYDIIASMREALSENGFSGSDSIGYIDEDKGCFAVFTTRPKIASERIREGLASSLTGNKQADDYAGEFHLIKKHNSDINVKACTTVDKQERLSIRNREKKGGIELLVSILNSRNDRIR